MGEFWNYFEMRIDIGTRGLGNGGKIISTLLARVLIWPNGRLGCERIFSSGGFRRRDDGRLAGDRVVGSFG